MDIHEKIPSRLEEISEVTRKLEGLLQPAGVSPEDAFDIKLAFHEALVNAIKHGNKFSPELQVEVRVERKGNDLTIEIRDEGQGFDVKRLLDPTHPGNLNRTSGRGVFLIKKLMDSVEFFDCGRTIRMVKSLNKEAPGER